MSTSALLTGFGWRGANCGELAGDLRSHGRETRNARGGAGPLGPRAPWSCLSTLGLIWCVLVMSQRDPAYAVPPMTVTATTAPMMTLRIPNPFVVFHGPGTNLPATGRG
jgi:hypothetical protein